MGSIQTHDKERMTVTIAKKRKVTFENQMQAEVDVNRIDSIGRVIDTITYKGKIVGRDQFGNELRMQAPSGGILTFRLENIADIRQGDAMKGDESNG